jgi:hypothetical protein
MDEDALVTFQSQRRLSQMELSTFVCEAVAFWSLIDQCRDSVVESAYVHASRRIVTTPSFCRTILNPNRS